MDSLYIRLYEEYIYIYIYSILKTISRINTYSICIYIMFIIPFYIVLVTHRTMVGINKVVKLTECHFSLHQSFRLII